MLIQYYKQQFQVISEFKINNTVWYRGQLRFKNGKLGKKSRLFCSEWENEFFTIIKTITPTMFNDSIWTIEQTINKWTGNPEDYSRISGIILGLCWGIKDAGYPAFSNETDRYLRGLLDQAFEKRFPNTKID